MTYNESEFVELIKAHGFDQFGPLNLDSLEFMPEVRAMCSADKCRNYGKSWSCPPACGDIEHSFEMVKGHTFGMIVQTIGKMEDEFDYETMMDTGKIHSDNFVALMQDIKKKYKNALGLGAGTCKICEKCAYPDEPCRFPDKMVVSMEAAGLFVSRVCSLSGVPYNNGPLTITFTSCFMI